MKRRKWLLTAACALAAIAFSAIAQKDRDVPKIGLLWVGSGSDSFVLAALREGLRAQGYVEGKTILIDTRFLVDGYERLGESADRLVQHKVDVIVCYGVTATLAARKATSVIPIVAITGADLVNVGVTASLSNPGGNVTGVTFLHPQIDGKRLQLLREVVPDIRRVGILLNPASATEARNFTRWREAATTLGLEVEPIEIRVKADIDPVISKISRERIEALGVVGGSMFVANRTQIVAAIAKTRLPAIYGSSDYPEVGGLMSYGPNVAEGFQRAAGHVAKILKGAKPADIPVEQAIKFELAINMKTAKAIGLTIPQALLLRVDEVIQ
jgi:putative ABC transport system substrate-binding protein